MRAMEELADALARDVLAAQDELGDDRFYDKVAKVLGETSPTMQEVFMTAVRIRIAEARARRFFDRSLSARRHGGAPPPPPRETGPGH